VTATTAAAGAELRIALLSSADVDADGTAGEALRAVAASLGAQAIALAPGGEALPACDAVIVAGAPGGAGSGAMRAVAAFAAAGAPVLGIGGGFRALCDAGLLPGTFAGGAGAAVVETAGAVHLRVEGRPTPFTSAIPAGRVMRLHATAWSAGQYTAADAAELERRGQIVFRYCDAAGGATDAANPTRSVRSIAGVCNAAGNVVAVVIQPRAGDGASQLIQSLLLHLRIRTAKKPPRKP
jgi:phosphoribosylformylglycinamidine synthase